MLCRSRGGSLQDLFFSHFHRNEQEWSGHFGHRDESMSHQWFLKNVEEELEHGLQLELCMALGSGRALAFPSFV